MSFIKKFDSKSVIINDYDGIINYMLTRDKVPEINHNISFIDFTGSYNPKKIEINGDAKYYSAIEYLPRFSTNFIESLVNGLKTLVINVLIMGIIVLLILIYVMFLENKHVMLSLKFLGYKKSNIISLIITPYLLSFITITAIVIAGSYFLVKFLAYKIFD